MVKKIINIGIEGNDATGDPIRNAFEKTNDNFNELYSFFGKGDGIRFTDLTDYDSNRNGALVSESIFIVNNSGDPTIAGSRILAKTLRGDGVEIDNTDPNEIVLKSSGSKLIADGAPTLIAPLNANGQLIYSLKDPTFADSAGLGIPLTSFAATQGYVGSNFVKIAGDTMRGSLSVPAGATGNQVPRKNEVVGISGDTMTGPLKLFRNPIPSDDLNYNGLIAATKNYVDTTSFSSQVNLFVSTSGDDFRFDIAESKRGSALAYAFKTVNRACFKAEQLLKAAAIELGPYQKPIFFNNGNRVSVLSSVSSVKADGVTYVLTITNGGGDVGTDMRGTSLTATATIDVRAGLIIRGTVSGALAMITMVNPGVGAGTTIDGITYGGTETYDVIFKNFQDYPNSTQPVAFIVGEPLEYSDGVKKLNITIFVESGEYYENLPIRVPDNVTIVGDDTRRVIIRPKSGPSASLSSQTYFRRDVTIDGLKILTPVSAGDFIVGQEYTIASLGTSPSATTQLQWNAIAGTTGRTYSTDGLNNTYNTFKAATTGASSGNGTAYCAFGYHYLTNPSKNFYNNTQNTIDTYNPIQLYSTTVAPRFINGQTYINSNKTFFQDEILAFINFTYPGEYSLSLQNTWYQDIGSIVNALQSDLLYGGYSRILEAAMAFFSNTIALREITGNQLTKTEIIINRLNALIIAVLRKTNPDEMTLKSTSRPVVLDINPESGFDQVIPSLITVMLDIIKKNASVNFPKNNDLMDVFLLNDSTRLRTISCQGHGGFMSVLDPTGSIITKSPYVFQCSSFTKSINKQQFGGGMFVDAFTGNLNCIILERLSETIIKVGGLTRRTPTNIPVSFVIKGVRFEVDYIDRLNTYNNGEYTLYLNNNTPDNILYTGLSSQFIQGTAIELQTAGNRSMLCSDFTQINDLSYGIISTNGSVIEAVSIFTYYCYRGFYALNGSQIRSLNGSCAYGTYALNSEGSDPTEVSTPAQLRYPMIQVLSTYSVETLLGKNAKTDVVVFVRISKDRSVAYKPFTSSELEIDHGIGDIKIYNISNSSYSTTIGNDEIWGLSINTSNNATGLKYDVPHGTNVIVRNLKNFDVLHLPIVNQSRPSTALQFNNEAEIYHLSSYNQFTKSTVMTSIPAQSGNTVGNINVTPGSTVGLIPSETIIFSGTAFGGLLTNTKYYVLSSTNSTIRLSSSLGGAGITLTPSTSTTISSISNGSIVLTANITLAEKGTSWLYPSTASGINELTPGVTYYIAARVTNSATITLSADYYNSLSGSPTVITVTGTPSGTLSGALLGGYLEGVIGSVSDKNISSTLTIDANYNYVTVTPQNGLSGPNNTPGDTTININKITSTDRPRIVGMIFAWGGTVHKITSHTYSDPSFDTIVFTPGLTKNTSPSAYSNIYQTLKAGLNNVKYPTVTDVDLNQVGLFLNSKISVVRASGHDLIDIGTGGFANSNIPANIYGAPATAKAQANEVQEIGRGRVFYSSTDQDGNFKVGKYFQVDQGTGQVTFSASLSITGIDGLGFSRGGVTVKEFSPSEDMGNVASDTVPTQSAVVAYVNKRLGLTYPGNTATPGMLGPGFLARDGSTPFGYNDTNNSQRLDMASHRIANLGSPQSDSDATNKSYVDSFLKRGNGVRKSIDGFTMSGTTQFTIQTVARSNGVATIMLRDDSIRSGVHGLSVGSKVTVVGADDPYLGFEGTWTVKSVLSPNGYLGSIGSSDCIGFTYDNPNEVNRVAIIPNKNLNPTVVGAVVITDSHISMSGAKITNLLDPTDVYDAVNKKYVDDVVATKDQLSELFDVGIVDIKTAGNFVVGIKYKIASLGTTTQLQWNTIANTTGVTYVVGSIFTAAAVGASSGDGTAYAIILDGQPLSYNSLTSKWVNNRAIDQSKLSLRLARAFEKKPSNAIVTAGNFVIGKTYIIVSPAGTSNDQWNLLAGTSGITYEIGSYFVATTAGVGSGTATEDIQANSGIASFYNSQFNVDTSGFVTLADNGIALSKLGRIGTGYLIGNTSGVDATPALVTFANALNAAITIPASPPNLTAAPAGIIAKGADATFSTLLYSVDNVTDKVSILQRDATGGIKVTAVDATGLLKGGTLSVGASTTGSIISSSTISAKTELQMNEVKLFGINGTSTEMFNRVGGKVADFTGTLNAQLTPNAPTGNLYGSWTVPTLGVTTLTTTAITTGANTTAGTITGNWSLGTGSKLQATYADLAEYYSSDNDYSAGTVVMIGGEQDVTLAKGFGNTAVAGVVSENPAYLMNSGCEGIRVAIALQGRVPCKVVGSIKKGDLLVVSQVAGAATTSKDPRPGSIIGKALANYESDRIGMIEVLVGKH
jgi:hypothetical protein